MATPLIPVVARRPQPVPVPVSLTAIALGGFGIGTTEFVSMGLLPQIAGDLGASIPAGGHLISSYALGVVVGAPAVAVLAAKVARTRLLIALMAAFALGNAASALAPTFDSLVAARFLAGLPHGAYFGIASVVAAGLVSPGRRGRAIAIVMSGLTVANLVGVPATTWLGQTFGWRSTYWVVAAIAVLTAVLVWQLVPAVAAEPGTDRRRELSTLRRPAVWLALATGAIGFGGVFAVYSYVSPLVTEVAGAPLVAVPVVLAVFGLGMTLGMPFGGRLTDWSVSRSVLIGLGGMAVVLLTLPAVAHWTVALSIWIFALAFAGAISVLAVQTWAMDAAGSGQATAASLNHSAFNVANALGAFGGGVAIELGFGWTSPAVFGAALAAVGLAVALPVLRQAERAGRAGDPAQPAGSSGGPNRPSGPGR